MNSDKHHQKLRASGLTHKDEYRAKIAAGAIPFPNDGRYSRDKFGCVCADHEGVSVKPRAEGAPALSLRLPPRANIGTFDDSSVVGGAASTVMPHDSISNVGGPAPMFMGATGPPRDCRTSVVSGFSSLSSIRSVTSSTSTRPGTFDPTYGVVNDLDDHIDWADLASVWRTLSPIDCNGREIPATEFYFGDPQFDASSLAYAKEVRGERAQVRGQTAGAPV